MESSGGFRKAGALHYGIRNTKYGARETKECRVTASIDAELCYRQHRGRVYRWALAMCGQRADAHDVTHEVFLRFLRAPPQVSAPAALVAWLRTVTSRVVIDRWRRRREAPLAAVDEPDQPAGPERDLEQEETRQRLRRCLARLSEQQRLVLMAKVYDGQTFEQIARELGLATPTVKTHYIRALAAMRERLAACSDLGVQP